MRASQPQFCGTPMSARRGSGFPFKSSADKENIMNTDLHADTVPAWWRNYAAPLMGAEETPVVDEVDHTADTPAADANNDSDGDPNDAPADSADTPADTPADSSGDGAAAQKLKDYEAKLAKAEQAAIKAKQEANAIKAEQAEKSGNYKQLAQQRESEAEDAKEALAKVEAEREKAVQNLETFQKKNRVISIAQRLGYRDPEDAMAVLANQEAKLREKGEDHDLAGDDASTERWLRQIAESKKYLVDTKRATGRPMNGSGQGNNLSIEQIKGMSQDEVTARLDEVHAALAAQSGR